MMNEKDFNNYVKGLRNVYPSYNHGRDVLVLSEYSKAGKNILERASYFDGYWLSQVYDNPSAEKERIYDSLFEMYSNDKNADSFGICSHNGFTFTVSWVTKGEVLFFTKSKEYHVICNE